VVESEHLDEIIRENEIRESIDYAMRMTSGSFDDASGLGSLQNLEKGYRRNKTKVSQTRHYL